MIRYLTKRNFSAGSWLRFLLYPDPECLCEFPAEFEGGAARRDQLCSEFSRVMSSIRIGRIYKVTSPARLEETNRVLCAQLRKRGIKQIHFLDLGGSDGITTLETLRLLESKLDIAVCATLVDRYIDLQRYESSWLTEYRMSDGSPVMARLGCLGLLLSDVSPTRYPVSRWLGRLFLSCRAFREAMPLTATFSLINPMVVAHPSLAVVEWNALERNPDLVGQFDVIRASNILNLGYFSRPQIEQALSHLHDYLVDSGLLIVSRNHYESCGQVEHGSLWSRQSDGFKHLDDFGGGSYIANIVDDLRTSAVQR